MQSAPTARCPFHRSRIACSSSAMEETPHIYGRRIISFLRCTAKPEGYRWPGTVMPRETGGRPFLRLPLHFAQPAGHYDKDPCVRRPRVLDGAKATFHRPFQMVARGEWTWQVAGSLRSTVINGGRGCLTRPGGAHVAPGERLTKRSKKTFPAL